MSGLFLDACVRSDVGNVRKNNEDNYYICGQYREDVNENDSRKECRVPDREALFSVCDGMGGEAYGEVASLIAVSNMKPCLCTEFDTVIIEEVQKLNSLVCAEVLNRGHVTMGTTLTSIYIDNGEAVACNVGDSRIYLLRDGELKMLSVDHDQATHLMNMGLITKEQAANDPRRHQLTQFLGMTEDDIIPEPHIGERITIEPGDRFLICSDGITDVLDDEAIKDALSRKRKASAVVNDLINTALLKKSKDNCTAMVIDVKKKFFFPELNKWV